MFIRKHGKKAFLSVHNKLHEKYEFAKTQEILGQDMYEGLKILEETYSFIYSNNQLKAELTA